MSLNYRDYWKLFTFSGLIIIADQITKEIVRNNLGQGDQWSPWEWLSPYARIVHWYNTGAAFGMFQGMGLFFSILSVLVVIAIIYYFPRVPQSDWSLRVAMIFQMGGAIGNLIDRIRLGHVTDFISIGNFPVFNIADSCITMGVVILIIGVWIQERTSKQSGPPRVEITDRLQEAKDGEGLD